MLARYLELLYPFARSAAKKAQIESTDHDRHGVHGEFHIRSQGIAVSASCCL